MDIDHLTNIINNHIPVEKNTTRGTFFSMNPSPFSYELNQLFKTMYKALATDLRINNKDLDVKNILAMEYKLCTLTAVTAVAQTIQNFKSYNTTVNIRFVRVKSGVSYLNGLSTEDGYIEVRQISLALQTSPTHKIRVFTKKDNINGLELLDIIVASGTITEDTAISLMYFIPSLIQSNLNLEMSETMTNIIKDFGNKINDIYTTQQRCIDYIVDVLDLHDINTVILKKFLETRMSTIQNRTTQQINSKRNTIRDYENALKDIYKEINTLLDKQFRLDYMATEAREQDDTLLNFVKNINKKGQVKLNVLPETSYSDLYLNIEAPLKYVDIEALSTIIKNSGTKTFKTDWCVKLFEDTFINEKYEIWCYTSISLQPFSTNTMIIDNAYGSRMFPHPHIMRYHCLGDNNSLIRAALREDNLMQAVEQTIAATYNLNFADGIVLREMIANIINQANLLNPTLRFIKDLETGNMLTIKEFRDKLNKPTNEQIIKTVKRNTPTVPHTTLALDDDEEENTGWQDDDWEDDDDDDDN